jgi:PD-(D/E)XK nuclease superfamily
LNPFERVAVIHEDLTEKIIAACFDVSNELGAGFLENVYEKALLIACKDRGLNVRSQVPLHVTDVVKSIRIGFDLIPFILFIPVKLKHLSDCKSFVTSCCRKISALTLILSRYDRPMLILFG